jgi:predicted RNA binding protein YcfA (HicA-like mRNA interferase family)
MPRFSPLKPKEVEKILLKNGFFLKRQTGSHRIYYNSKTEKITVVPYHSRDIPKGTLKSIIKQSDLSQDLFFKR